VITLPSRSTPRLSQARQPRRTCRSPSVPLTRRVAKLGRGAGSALLALLGGEQAATAEEAKFEYADGVKACSDFSAKKERELATWTKAQPAIPYEYPRDDNVLGAPWGPSRAA
jgi:hypothetical protein